MCWRFVFLWVKRHLYHKKIVQVSGGLFWRLEDQERERERAKLNCLLPSSVGASMKSAPTLASDFGLHSSVLVHLGVSCPTKMFTATHAKTQGCVSYDNVGFLFRRQTHRSSWHMAPFLPPSFPAVENLTLDNRWRECGQLVHFDLCFYESLLLLFCRKLPPVLRVNYGPVEVCTQRCICALTRRTVRL